MVPITSYNYSIHGVYKPITMVYNYGYNSNNYGLWYL